MLIFVPESVKVTNNPDPSFLMDREGHNNNTDPSGS